VPDGGETVGDGGEIWVGAFGGGGAGFLVGTTLAGIGFTCLFTFCPWTVCRLEKGNFDQIIAQENGIINHSALYTHVLV